MVRKAAEEGGEVMMCSMILLAALLGQTYHDTRDMIEDMQWQLNKQAMEAHREIEEWEKNHLRPPIDNPPSKRKVRAKPPATSKPALTKAQREAQIQKNLAKNRDAAKQAKPPETNGAK